MGDVQQHDYVVLARKWRPRNFAELVGQDALVRTLTNAIAAQKIHHAYVLTGIRGVGKTTTARIIAKALNCNNGPSATWDENDPDVLAIATGRHVDVLEFDAASNRGVEDVQKLFEGVNYAPVSGRYKVYIIDEVHMLSTTAFNALLKTLEEPPPRVKFIFATTEVHKIPVTVLSRCQRFDLKRIPSEVLAPYFEKILGEEKIEAEPAAVAMIARAADGSARDGLSLLDQAIALSHGDKVRVEVVQGMLGLADRARLYDLLECVLDGAAEKALAILDELYAGGQDALGVVQGMMEMVHGLTRLKIVPGLKDGKSLSELEVKRAVPLAERSGMANLGRLYQMLLQALGEVKIAERPYEALSMATVRAAYLAPLPAMDKLLAESMAKVEKLTAAEPAASAGARAVHEKEEPRDLPVVNAGMVREEKQIQVAAVPQEWHGVVKAVKDLGKSTLAAELEKRGRCVTLEGTKVVISLDKGLVDPRDIVRDLRVALRDATGVGWEVSLDQSGQASGATVDEVEKQAKQAQKVAAAEDPAVAEILGMFPGAEVEDVRGTAQQV